jgi:chloramphenicol 3-O phosphotransferase
MSKIIFLNGCSSAGKTSLVKEIQNLSDEFWLTFGIDSIIDAMPDKYWGEKGEKVAEGFNLYPALIKRDFPLPKLKLGRLEKK